MTERVAVHAIARGRRRQRVGPCLAEQVHGPLMVEVQELELLGKLVVNFQHGGDTE